MCSKVADRLAPTVGLNIRQDSYQFFSLFTTMSRTALGTLWHHTQQEAQDSTVVKCQYRSERRPDRRFLWVYFVILTYRTGMVHQNRISQFPSNLPHAFIPSSHSTLRNI
jgi:hypothetical protein